jgi:hypothetical protein
MKPPSAVALQKLGTRTPKQLSPLVGGDRRHSNRNIRTQSKECIPHSSPMGKRSHVNVNVNVHSESYLLTSPSHLHLYLHSSAAPLTQDGNRSEETVSVRLNADRESQNTVFHSPSHPVPQCPSAPIAICSTSCMHAWNHAA